MLRDRFIEGMSRAAATVAVVTTAGPAGRAGVTVSAMASVSADSTAPSLLVCVHRLSPAAPAILTNGVFCVNVLKDSQAGLSDTFAGRRPTSTGDKFEAGTWTTLSTGAPVLLDALVAFDCKVGSATLYGSHYILVGELEEAVVADTGPALVYANRAYGSPIALGGAPASRRALSDETLSRTVVFGCFSSLAPYAAPRLLAEFLTHHPDADARVVEGDQEDLVRALRNGSIEFAVTFAAGLPADVAQQHLADIAPYVLLPAGHPLADSPAVPLSALADEPMVLHDVSPANDYVMALFTGIGLTPSVAYRSPSFEMVRSMVGNGLGYAILGTKPASPMTYDGRAVTAGPVAPVSLALVTAADATPSGDAAALMMLFRLRLGPEPEPARRRVGPTGAPRHPKDRPRTPPGDSSTN
jgi:flavin reductase (DIM6/NTAB) family NADH-FMN oxidoreductase RutF/DNA-binding transcriptional LysR family regulator